MGNMNGDPTYDHPRFSAGASPNTPFSRRPSKELRHVLQNDPIVAAIYHSGGSLEDAIVTLSTARQALLVKEAKRWMRELPKFVMPPTGERDPSPPDGVSAEDFGMVKLNADLEELRQSLATVSPSVRHGMLADIQCVYPPLYHALIMACKHDLRLEVRRDGVTLSDPG